MTTALCVASCAGEQQPLPTLPEELLTGLGDVDAYEDLTRLQQMYGPVNVALGFAELSDPVVESVAGRLSISESSHRFAAMAGELFSRGWLEVDPAPSQTRGAYVSETVAQCSCADSLPSVAACCFRSTLSVLSETEERSYLVSEYSDTASIRWSAARSELASRGGGRLDELPLGAGTAPVTPAWLLRSFAIIVASTSITWGAVESTYSNRQWVACVVSDPTVAGPRACPIRTYTYGPNADAARAAVPRLLSLAGVDCGANLNNAGRCQNVAGLPTPPSSVQTRTWAVGVTESYQ